jgi:hypothetical protein
MRSDQISSFNSSNAVALENSCRCITTVLSYSFLLIIPFSSKIATSVARRILISSGLVNTLPVTILSDPRPAMSLSDLVCLLLEMIIYLLLIVSAGDYLNVTLLEWEWVI